MEACIVIRVGRSVHTGVRYSLLEMIVIPNCRVSPARNSIHLCFVLGMKMAGCLCNIEQCRLSLLRLHTDCFSFYRRNVSRILVLYKTEALTFIQNFNGHHW